MRTTFDDLLSEEIRNGQQDLRKYLKKGQSSLYLTLEDARKNGVDEKVIQNAEEKGMITGDLYLTYEGAKRIYDKLKADLTQNESEIIDHFDHIRDADLIANYIFCVHPEVRERVGNTDGLYKVVLNVGTKKKRIQPVREKSEKEDSGGLSSHLEELIGNIPREEYKGDKEYQRRLRILLVKKAERDIFPQFKENREKAFDFVRKKIKEEKNKNIKDIYQEIQKTYKAYDNIRVLGVNEEFRDPETGEKGVLPSLHQNIAIYHLLKEKKFGVFDGCGTGKTAIATLAQPLIQEAMEEDGREFKRTVIVCPNNGKKAWKKGFLGNIDQRYLDLDRVKEEDVIVINGGRKDESFLKELEDKKWIVVNYEQLITRTDDGRLFVDALIDLGVDYSIFDEAHHIKSQRTLTKSGKPTCSAAAQKLAHSSEYLCLLTGSPISNNMDDFAVLYHVLNPNHCPEPKKFIELYEENPRILYTFFNEKSIRRTSQDINKNLKIDEKNVDLSIDPIQRQIYEHIVEFRAKDWLMQARKALLDPRLVDPSILQSLGVLGKLNFDNSVKYKKLEELLGEEKGPISKKENFIIYSSIFREGVTQKGHEKIREKYARMGLTKEYQRLQLDHPLNEVLEERLSKKFKRHVKIGVIDGTIIDIEEREKIVDRLGKDLDGIICTTETGGESLDFTQANWAYFVDKDYNPKTEEQAVARIARKGQHKKVNISHLMILGTLEEQLENYVEKKIIINRTAMDGHPLTQPEIEILEDTEGKKFVELIRKGLGGKSINTFEVEAKDLGDFELNKRRYISRKSSAFYVPGDETTDAQVLMQWIGRDPIGCWKDPTFVDLYMKTLPNLSVPVVHRAKILDLASRALNGSIQFPKTIISEGSGPSLLYSNYQNLGPLLESFGLNIPTIFDRDTSALMLKQGKNNNKILGDMTGKNSKVPTSSFQMVDNASISLLKNTSEVKESLLEAHRILKPNGLIGLTVEGKKFFDGSLKGKDFYTGLEGLGFELITDKNVGFNIGRGLFQRIKQEKGEHYAESYARKLSQTYYILARKKDDFAEVNAENFWFETLAPEENGDQVRDPSETRSIIKVRSRARRKGGRAKKVV
ncbi:MAG: DEAD/DEAH box helicase [Nanoarchaeota archaeon]|nr:DEAD/DEAH box helicase [Nanoarchaeota archaeon]